VVVPVAIVLVAEPVLVAADNLQPECYQLQQYILKAPRLGLLK
jgi:hypothetical protein